MTEFKRILPAVLVVLTGFLILYLMIFFGNKSSRKFRMELFETGRYSIGKVNKKVSESRVTYYIYQYEFKNKIYKGKYIGKKLKINGDYFLLFNTSKPNDKYLLGAYPVPDSIKSAPPDGWEEIPIPVSKEELRKYLEFGRND